MQLCSHNTLALQPDDRQTTFCDKSGTFQYNCDVSHKSLLLRYIQHYYSRPRCFFYFCSCRSANRRQYRCGWCWSSTLRSVVWLTAHLVARRHRLRCNTADRPWVRQFNWMTSLLFGRTDSLLWQLITAVRHFALRDSCYRRHRYLTFTYCIFLIVTCVDRAWT